MSNQHCMYTIADTSLQAVEWSKSNRGGSDARAWKNAGSVRRGNGSCRPCDNGVAKDAVVRSAAR